MPTIGLSELIVILMIVVLVFGASRLPQIGEGVGRAIKNFKRGMSSDDSIKVARSEPAAKSEKASSEPEPADAEIVDSKS